MEIFIGAVLIGLLPAFIAQSKGKSFIGWWIYGALLFIVALPHSLIMKADAKSLEAEALADGGRKCPYCAEIVKAEAKVCRFCQRDISETPCPSHSTPSVVTAKGAVSNEPVKRQSAHATAYLAELEATLPADHDQVIDARLRVAGYLESEDDYSRAIGELRNVIRCAKGSKLDRARVQLLSVMDKVKDDNRFESIISDCHKQLNALT